ncbi:MAG: hypothetical protein BWX54_02169 [Verrucomicrobia bacterium ADurb.Bin018]|nr:MAG: hypothetical protein BWX54_02169 [Verrucomicrobia bacterium ADurb.Bin018]
MVIQQSAADAQQKHESTKPPPASAPARAVGVLPQVRQRAEHEAHKEVQRGGFMARKKSGQKPAAKQQSETRCQEKRGQRQQQAAEIPQRVGKSAGQRPVESAQHE